MANHVTAFGPGRVNLIGEHTDYNQGLALPFAVGEGVTVKASAIAGHRIEVAAADLDAADSFELERPARIKGWRAFARGIVSELRAAGVPIGGATLWIAGTVPRGAGLSSSAALEVALALALIALSDEPERDPHELDRVELAKLCSRVENEWVGAQTGLLDQLASLCGEAGHAVRIDFRSLELRQVPMELHGHTLVTIDSGEKHSHAASGYNERRAQCTEACRRLGIESLRDATPELVDRLPDPLDRRARHVLSENVRVDQAVEALHRPDLRALGRLLDESHASLRDDYDVSTAAVEAAVKRLKDHGALGARIMGGGFGGRVLGLLAPGAEPPAEITEVRASDGARVVG